MFDVEEEFWASGAIQRYRRLFPDLPKPGKAMALNSNVAETTESATVRGAPLLGELESHDPQEPLVGREAARP